MSGIPCKIFGTPICRCNTLSATSKSVTVKESWRKLFTDHAVYTKFYISSYLNNIADAPFLLDRLMENQKEIGDYLKDFVSESRGNEMTILLKEHISMVGNYLVALRTGTGTNIEKSYQEIFDNSSRVSKFLSTLNPEKLPFETVKKEFDQHNQFVVNLAQINMRKDYKNEIKEYDMYYNHMIQFSDILSSALSANIQMGEKGGYRGLYSKYKLKYMESKKII